MLVTTLFFENEQDDLYKFVKKLGSFSKIYLNNLNNNQFGGLNCVQATKAVIGFVNTIVEQSVKKKTLSNSKEIKGLSIDKNEEEQSPLKDIMIEINESPLNMLVLDDDPENYSYIRNQLMNAKPKEPIDFTVLHHKKFGENTIWKKIEILQEIKNSDWEDR